MGRRGGEGQPPLSIVKIAELLARQGFVVPYRTLHRFAVERCGFRAKSTTVRVNDGEPGMEWGVLITPSLLMSGRVRRVASRTGRRLARS